MVLEEESAINAKLATSVNSHPTKLKIVSHKIQSIIYSYD